MAVAPVPHHQILDQSMKHQSIIPHHQPPVVDSKPIKDSFPRRIITRAIVKLLRQTALRNVSKKTGGVFFLFNICIKVGPAVSLAEASTLRFIKHYTSIPVPEVHCAFTHKSETFIVMERIHGHMLAETWKSCPAESRVKLLEQLREMVQELRKIQSKGRQVSNIDGGPVYDVRLPKTSCWGPFNEICDFHEQLRNGVNSCHRNVPLPVQQLISFHDKQQPSLIFTHGDLSSFNIMACGDRITGIVDWETAGWFPEYWEYVNAWNVNPQNQFWQAEIDKFLHPMPYALEMEKIRRDYFGDT